MNRKITFSILVIFILLIIHATYLSYLERKNITFKKCLDVLPNENLIEVARFKVNVEICKKQS
ncbi:MAG: hypothetical protein RLZZ308_655 [Candidatus Parcubacteria bacterium]|jgi:nucleoside recognition membrane protein YjiH